MAKYQFFTKMDIKEIPEFQRVQEANPLEEIDNVVIMYGRAIHWITIFQILWPLFAEKDSYSVQVKHLIKNDPDQMLIPEKFYVFLGEVLKDFWTIQLSDLYPLGDWEVKICDDKDMTVQATVFQRLNQDISRKPKYNIQRLIGLEDIPEYQRFRDIYSKGELDEIQTAKEFVHAIHWISILKCIWPSFEETDCYWEETAYIVQNDPDRSSLPDSFYRQVQEMLKVFWTIQLDDIYPDGDWFIETRGLDVQAVIRRRYFYENLADSPDEKYLQDLFQKYISARLPGYLIQGKLIYSEEFEYYLKGFYFSDFSEGAGLFEIKVFFQPLFVPVNSLCFAFEKGGIFFPVKTDKLCWEITPDNEEQEMKKICVFLNSQSSKYLKRIDASEFFKKHSVLFLNELWGYLRLKRLKGFLLPKVSLNIILPNKKAFPEYFFALEAIIYRQILKRDYRTAYELCKKYRREIIKIIRIKPDHFKAGMESQSRIELMAGFLRRQEYDLAFQQLHRWIRENKKTLKL